MKQQAKYRWLREFILPIGTGVLVAFVIRTFVATAAVVPSASMYPTIPAISPQEFSIITVNKLATELGSIHRGEVVTFYFPDKPSKVFVKRVVGLPGDTVTVTGNAVYINGKKLNEDNMNITRSNGTALGTYHVPAGHYFMMGDNRPPSDDSRLWVHKYVARSAIIGKADFVIYPLNKIGAISQSLSSPSK